MPNRRWATKLLLVAASIQFLLSTWHVITFCRTATERVRFPFTCSPSGRIVALDAVSLNAGLRTGDQILKVDGEAFAGMDWFRGMLQRTGPKQELSVEVRRGDSPVHAGILTIPYYGEPASLHDWLVTVVIHSLMPLLCLVLAIAVSWRRMLDDKSKMLALALVAFMGVYPLAGWSIPLFLYAHVFHTWAQSTAGYWLYRLGLVFPEEGGAGSKPGWLRLAIGVGIWTLLAIKLAGDAAMYFGPSESYGVLSQAWAFAGRAQQILNVACALLFAMNLSLKAARSSIDGRRRLRILALGSLISIGPVALLVTRGAVLGQAPFRDVPWWVAELALMALTVFPLTLGYVVAASRAMDIHVMVRQGIYYSSAKRGLQALRMAVLCAVFTALAIVLQNPALSDQERLLWISGSALVVAFAQEGALRWLQVWMDHKFFRDAYQLDDIVETLRQVKNADHNHYIALIADSVQSAIPVEGCAVLYRSEDYFRPSRVDGVLSEIPAIRRAAMPTAFQTARGPVMLPLSSPLQVEFEGLSQKPEIALPLLGSDGLVGLVLMTSKRSGEPFTPTDKAALSAIGEHAGLVLENLMLMETRDQEVSDRERRRAETQAAEEASRAKSEFLARMSHELRTPLNAIIGYSEMLGEEAEDDGLESFVTDLGKIRSAGKHLLELINAVLDISKIEAGKMDVYPETFKVETLIGEVASMLAPLIGAKGNRLETAVDPGLGAMNSDAGKLRQILINLLSNASKFTSEGTIHLTARTTGGGQVKFEVRDSGIGMTPEQMEKLFQPFQQADASISAKYGGTGLGLTICKRFSELLGGTISVSSQAGVGTTFTVTLPQRYGETPAPTVARMGSGPLVLVIDDDPAVLDLVTRSLAKEGFQIATACSGEEGIAMARELKPDAILLDLMLGGSDGWSVLAHLREAEGESTPPVVLMSILDESRKGIALGADAFLVKPVDRQQLKQTLDAVIPKSSRTRRALVVDDQPAQRLHLRRMLQNQGWRVSEGANGQEGLRILARERLAVVLLDLNLPGMEGVELLSELRSNHGGEQVPIVVVTSDQLTAAERASVEANMETLVESQGTELSLVAEKAVREVMQKIRLKGALYEESTAG